MPEVKTKVASKYALKIQGKRIPVRNNRVRRICDRCKLGLAGRRAHGWPVQSGRLIVCSGCLRRNES